VLAGVPPRYQAQLAALTGAVREGEDDMARRMALRLRARLGAEASGGMDPGLQAALAILEGCDRILRGRLLLEALDLELAERPGPDANSTRVVLRARSRSRTRVEVRPGGALLRVHRITLGPEGKEGRIVRTYGVGSVELLSLDEGWLEVPLGAFSTTIPSNTLGARTHWTLELLAGEVLEEGRPYPAQEIQVQGSERIDLAPFLPNTPVAPEDLAAYVTRPGVALAPILERTVRIAPADREQALDRLTPLVEVMVAEQITRLVPTLRWLSRTGVPGRDPLAWREWLRRRAQVRGAVR